ncbi:MAG: PilZ domain-containing protein [Gammaproteobacteria bacterium]|nr:PilZ domain-containing protein [Gammaproteobacteria bacterium]
MNERRKHKRINSPEPLPVLDRITGDRIGLLVDLSFGGLLLESNTLLQVEETYQLQIILPQAVGKSKKIEFTAEIVWSNTQEPHNTFCAGLQVIEISDYELERIEQLLGLWMLENASVRA